MKRRVQAEDLLEHYIFSLIIMLKLVRKFKWVMCIIYT
jgi:hypothetical protein